MFDDDIFWVVGLMLFCFVILIFLGNESSKDNMTRKDILEKTEQYEKYDYCEKIDEKWYCFNEN